jgi:hypothetical protein
MGCRTAKIVAQVRSYTLCQLEVCLASWIPQELFPKAPDKSNSRDRDYTRWRTFWCMLWQAFNPEAPGREVVLQLRALFELENGPTLSKKTGGFFRAKARLPLGEFPKALAATAKAADQQAPATTTLQGRPLKAVDGSSLTMADTPKNRKVYPPLTSTGQGGKRAKAGKAAKATGTGKASPAEKPNFPMMRIVVFFSLLSGAILALAQGSLGISELSLFGSLVGQLARGDILLGDRGFGCFPVVALLKYTLGIDFIGRTTRRVDGRRRLKRLGKNDWLILWKKGASPSPWLSALQWAGLPPELTLRAVKGSCYQKGFRVRRVTVVTTLLDPQLFSHKEILQAYARRWRLEMCLDDLKTTLKMDFMRGQSPAMVQKEVYVRLIAHNLIRCTMAEAATQHEVVLERLSFKGTLDALRQFSQAMARARSKKKRHELWAEMLATLAGDLVPLRPGRREPRARKRVKTKYPRLSAPRHKFRDRPKRNVRRTNSHLRSLGLM